MNDPFISGFIKRAYERGLNTAEVSAICKMAVAIQAPANFANVMASAGKSALGKKPAVPTGIAKAIKDYAQPVELARRKNALQTAVTKQTADQSIAKAHRTQLLNAGPALSAPEMEALQRDHPITGTNAQPNGKFQTTANQLAQYQDAPDPNLLQQLAARSYGAMGNHLNWTVPAAGVAGAGLGLNALLGGGENKQQV